MKPRKGYDNNTVWRWRSTMPRHRQTVTSLTVDMELAAARDLAAQRHHIVMMNPIIMIAKAIARFQAPMPGIGHVPFGDR